MFVSLNCSFVRATVVGIAIAIAIAWRFAVAIVSLAVVVSGSVHAVANCPAALGARTTPTSEFVPNNIDSTVTHSTTGLIWKKCVEGLSGANCEIGTVTAYTWTQALVASVASNFASYNDWRLPNKQELKSIMEYGCSVPAINETVFPGTPGFLTWTSSTLNALGQNALRVDFGGGNSNAEDKGIPRVARLVRSGDAFDALAPLPCGLDIDGDTNFVPNIDGLLIVRYLLGISGPPLVGGITIAATAPRRTNGDFTTFMTAHDFDIVGKGSPGTAAIDGMVLLRAMLGFKGTAVTAGLSILPAWQRPDWTAIGPYLRTVCLMPVTQ